MQNLDKYVFLKAVFLILSVIAVYYPALDAGFIWDDDTFFTQNPIMVSPDALYRFWFTTDPPDYFPLASTVLWIQRQLWDLNPIGYHLINILFHAGNSYLLWRVLVRTLVPGAWFAAMIFALHPIQVESVAWVTQIKTLQSTFFYLLAILCYLRSHLENSARTYGLSLFLFLLALLSKTSVVMLPFVLLVYHAWKRDLPIRKAFQRTIPFFLLSLFLSLTTIWYQYNSAGAIGSGWSLSYLERLVNAGHIVIFYLYKLIIPFDLTFVYQRWSFDPEDWFSWAPHIGLITLLVFLFVKRNSWGCSVLVGFSYFVVTLFPVLGFFNIYFMLYSFVADHYQYVAGPGVIALVTASIALKLSKVSPTVRSGGIVLAALVLMVLGTLTWKQQAIYKNSVVLWQDTLNKNPTAWIAHNNLGNEMELIGDIGKATWHYRQTLRLNPDYAEAEDNLGLALLKLDRFEEAKSHFSKAIQLKPSFWQPRNNLGTILANEGKLSEAARLFEEVLQIDPKNANAHNNLGLIRETQGRFSEAIRHWEVVFGAVNRPQTHNNMGAMLLDAGRIEEAIGHFQSALSLDPQFKEARSNLNLALEQKKGVD